MQRLWLASSFYTVTVGTGGTGGAGGGSNAGTAGGASTFISTSTLTANGGDPGGGGGGTTNRAIGGQKTVGVPWTQYAGGNSTGNEGAAATCCGGGGGGAGDTANGGNASGVTGGTGGASFGGAGGTVTVNSAGQAGNPGVTLGGGGSGNYCDGSCTGFAGGDGARGEIRITAISDNFSVVNVYVYDENNLSQIFDPVNLTISPVTINGSDVTYTINGTYTILNLTPGTYNFKFSSATYSLREYLVTISNATSSTVIAYLATTTSAVNFQILDSQNGAQLEGAIMTMARSLNGTLTTIDSQYTDITGIAQFQYVPLARYCFTITLSGYTSLQFCLDPILLSSYQVKLTSNTTNVNNTLDYAGISLVITPRTFWNNVQNNVTYTISSPNGTLTQYAINITYPGLVNGSQLYDRSGFNFTLVPVGNVTYTTTNGGYYDLRVGAINNSKSTDLVNYSAGATVSIWAKVVPGSIDTNERTPARLRNTTLTAPTYTIAYRNNTGTVRIYARLIGPGSVCDQSTDYNNNSLQTDDSWHHILASINLTNRFLYIDGELKSSGTINAACTSMMINETINQISKAIILGANSASASFNGSIDDFRVWNRTLTSAEVLQVYANESVPDGLVAWYPFYQDVNYTSIARNGILANGETFNLNFNISTFGIWDTVNISYSYTTPNTGFREYFLSYFITQSQNASSTGGALFAENCQEDYGMGGLDRMIVATIVILAVAGSLAPFLGPEAAGMIALFVLGWLVQTCFVPWWAAAISVLVGFAIAVYFGGRR